nr:MAG TPA: hypothetical protein [Bacteriophage sp.]
MLKIWTLYFFLICDTVYVYRLFRLSLRVAPSATMFLRLYGPFGASLP